MRILLICYEYPPIGGGGGVGAQQYAEAWVRGGHEVTVVTSSAPGLAPDEAANGVRVIRVASPGRRGRSTSDWMSMLSYNVTAMFYVLRHRRQLGSFQIINTHFSIPTGPAACMAARILGLPNVLTIIGGDIYDPSKKLSPHRHLILRWLNRWIINSADRVIAISSDTSRRAQQYYGIQQPIRVINYGFTPLDGAPGVERNRPSSSDKFCLIAVGRLVKRKGFDVLIRAMKHVPHGVSLRLVGDGPLEESLHRLAVQEGVADRVQLLGYRTRREIHKLLRDSDCFVLSSLHEGLGIVVQEAMDAGLPIVSTNYGGQVDLITHQRNGLLVNPGDHHALADAIRSVHANRFLAEAMARNNLTDIRALHMDRNSQLYIEVFRSLSAAPDAFAMTAEV